MYEEINQNRRRFLATAAMTMAATQLGRIGFARAGTAADRLPVEGKLPSLSGAFGWLTAPPLTAASLRGKVVLVD